ncbi:glutathione S-transferase-like [Thrips palmi]|uniref:glutathione transferase n=1 Tax=Thrips palmi TaxID=161013 RepID=A0A6P8ZMR1_THRPL|nr:glutathione S-transferase-like [Thrips palmi]XP_034241045.1 glutathione S-transferase-like [Thrips palmi]
MAPGAPIAVPGAAGRPSYRLHYFALAGLGEPVRYLLHYGRIPFEDVRIDAKQWPEHKKKMPFGTMPVLEVDGVMYTQSRAICRYLAGQVGLQGATPEECLHIDIVVETFNDLRAAVADWFYDANPETKATKLRPLMEKTAPFYLSKFEAMAEANGGYLANHKLTWADVYFCAPLTWFDAMLRQNVLEGYPALQALRRRVDALPGVADYVKSRHNAEKLCPRFIGP